MDKSASPVALVDSTSDDSDSLDDQSQFGSCSKMAKMFKVQENKFHAYDFDSRVGLNCSQIHCTFNCLLDEANQRFYVWMGDITVDKLTKSTFLNLANFADKNGATKMILIQNRDHCQKDEFKRLFKVVDGKRVGKKGMKEMMNEEYLHDYMRKYALYQVEIN